jgi:uncharacterized membrane protein YqaE (UPF0057 family)
MSLIHRAGFCSLRLPAQILPQLLVLLAAGATGIDLLIDLPQTAFIW